MSCISLTKNITRDLPKETVTELTIFFYDNIDTIVEYQNFEKNLFYNFKNLFLLEKSPEKRQELYDIYLHDLLPKRVKDRRLSFIINDIQLYSRSY